MTRLDAGLVALLGLGVAVGSLILLHCGASLWLGTVAAVGAFACVCGGGCRLRLLTSRCDPGETPPGVESQGRAIHARHVTGQRCHDGSTLLPVASC